MFYSATKLNKNATFLFRQQFYFFLLQIFYSENGENKNGCIICPTL